MRSLIDVSTRPVPSRASGNQPLLAQGEEITTKHRTFAWRER
jgi:hypothetical protein